MACAKFSIIETYDLAFRRVFQNLWSFVSLALVCGGLSLILWASSSVPMGAMALWLKGWAEGATSSMFPFYIVSFPIFPIMQLLISAMGVFLWLGYLRGIISIYDNQSWSFSSIWPSWSLWWRGIVASIIFYILMGLGFIFLIIPGLIVWVAYYFFIWILLDRPEIGAWASLKASGRLTKGCRMKIFCFLIIKGFLIAAGVVLLGLGILITMPVALVATTDLYRKLRDAASSIS